jgi:hypothetical protein
VDCPHRGVKFAESDFLELKAISGREVPAGTTGQHGQASPAPGSAVGCTVGLVYNVKSTMGKTAGAPRRGPGRPRKNASATSTASLDGIAGILDVVKNAERQRSQMRAALEKIQGVIADALVR